MPLQNANCPNCGGPVLFRWQQSVQTTCPYCRSILVRTDIDIRLVGAQAELPLESSPIQLYTEGNYRDKSFTVVGRIVYEWAQGIWSEWHIIFADGFNAWQERPRQTAEVGSLAVAAPLPGVNNAWLADAQLEYDISFATSPPQPIPPANQLRLGQQFHWFDKQYQITSLTRAHYRGVEGELPFQYWDKSDVLFADLRTTDNRFGTIDYSDPQPLLFLGGAMDFDELHLRNLRTFEGWTL